MVTQNTFVSSTLNYDTHENLLKDQEIVYLLNGDISGYENSANTSFVQNVLSNKLCYKFPVGYVFNGTITTGTDEYVVYLHNPITKKGRLDRVNFDNCTSSTFIESDCLYTEEKIAGKYKNINGSTRIYWTSKCEPFKFLDLDTCKLPYKRLSDCQECQDIKSDCQLECDELLVNKCLNFPCLETTSNTTGNLPNGNYQIAIAYANNNTTLTDYYIYPEVIKVHDNQRVSFGLELNFLDCHSTEFDQYEVVLISHRIDRGTLAEAIGYFDSSQKMISITNLDETFYRPLDFESLLSNTAQFQGAEFIANTNNSLVLGNLKPLPQFDWRPQASEVEVEWVLESVPEEEAHLHPSLMRGEVYPIDIVWEYKTGHISHKTHIPNNSYSLPTGITSETIAPDNKDHFEVNEECPNEAVCDTTPKKYWEVYNTAKVVNQAIGDRCSSCESTIKATGLFGYWESKDHYYPDEYPGGLSCKPIRHFKMPSHCIEGSNGLHIHTNEVSNTPICDKGCVNILTIRLKNVQPPVDCNGKPIPVNGYRVLIGNRDNHKSILHKGILYNTANEELACGTNNSATSQYSNYPFNDLQPDKFLGTRLVRDNSEMDANEPLNSFNRNKFTYHSPDIHYVKGSVGTEMKIYTEEIGKVSGEYHYTEDFPKYQILSKFGRITAQIVGILQANVVLNGEKCTKIITEEICERLATRVVKAEVKDFPVTDVNVSLGIVDVLTPAGNGTTLEPVVTEIQGQVKKEDYTYTETTVGDPPCTGTPECEQWLDNPANDGIPCVESYQVTNTEYVDCESRDIISAGTAIGIGGNRCCVKFITSAPEGTVLTILFDGQSYQGVVGNDKNVYIEFDRDCGETEFSLFIAAFPDWKLVYPEGSVRFSPDCECTGNTTTSTITETEECESPIDFIQEREWFERLPAMMLYYTQGLEAVQSFLKSIIKPSDYAVQYTAKADYSSYSCTNIIPGNCRRRIVHQQYLTPIRQIVNTSTPQKFNNWCSENSEYIELDCDILDPSVKDNTRVLYSDVFCGLSDCTNSGLILEDDCNNCHRRFEDCSLDSDCNPIQASSYYVGIIRYNPNQWGGLSDYLSRTVSCTQTKTTSDIIYAGDIYISKFTTVRKKPLWEKLPLGLPNNTEWNTQDYPNIGTPRFWLNVSNESLVEDFIELLPFGASVFGDHNLEQIINLCKCGGVFDLGSLDPVTAAAVAVAIGILLGQDGLTWADVLLALAAGTVTVELIEWLANIVVPILNGEAPVLTNPFKQKGIFYTHVTGVSCFWVESEFINPYREFNNLENSKYYPIVEPSTLAKSTNYHEPETFLYNLQYHWKGLSKEVSSKPRIDLCENFSYENSIIYSVADNDNLAGMDPWLNFPANNFQNFNNKYGKLTAIVEIDDFNLFVAFEDAVFTTQFDDSLTTDSGDTIYLGSSDAFSRRLKKIVNEETGYGGCIDPDSIISTRYGVFWFDRKRKKFLNYAGQLTDLTGNMQSWFQYYANGEVIATYDNFTDNIYLTDKDTGWTLSYKPKYRAWISHHSFIPDDYIILSNNFLSFKERGIWKHNQKCSYQTYYNKAYPFEVGFIIKDNFKDNVLQDLTIYTERYRDCSDKGGYNCKVYNGKDFFTDILIYNKQMSTGVKRIFMKDPNNMTHELSRDKILANKLADDCIYRINGFYADNTTAPFLCYNSDGCTYTTQVSENLSKEFSTVRGKWFRVHLKDDKNTTDKILLQLVAAKQDYINK